MKIAIVPAQVTTVEDKIAGNLAFSQLLLLTAPVFGGGALFVVLPPVFHAMAYKFVVIFILFLICSLLAIRIKSKLILFWLIVLLRYNLRSRYYVFNKRSLYGREEYRNKYVDEPEDELVLSTRKHVTKQSLVPAELAILHGIIENPAAHVAFETNKKGNLYVRITEVKSQI